MVFYIDGIIQIAIVFLSIIAGIFALSLFKVSHKVEHLRPWKPLIIALFLFAIIEILGALSAFKIFVSDWLTHVIPSVILILLMYALFLQIMEAEKWRI